MLDLRINIRNRLVGMILNSSITQLSENTPQVLLNNINTKIYHIGKLHKIRLYSNTRLYKTGVTFTSSLPRFGKSGGFK